MSLSEINENVAFSNIEIHPNHQIVVSEPFWNRQGIDMMLLHLTGSSQKADGQLFHMRLLVITALWSI